MENIKSHIQMPKFILKRFVNDQNYFYHYDVVSGIISKGFPKSLNTQLNFYSSDMEKLLSKNIEEPFSKIAKFIDQIGCENTTFYINQEQYNAILNYARSLLVRNPSLIEEAKKASNFSSLLKSEDQNSIAIYYGFQKAKEDKLFSDYFPTFLINKTSTPFVLPLLGMYEYIEEDEKKVVLPIDKFSAIMFLEKKQFKKYSDERGLLTKFQVTDDNTIFSLNQVAIFQQTRMKYGCVVSPSKELLTLLLKSIDNNDLNI